MSCFFIDSLQKFLQADLFTTKVAQRSVSKKFNVDLNSNFYDVIQRGKLFCNRYTLYISKIKVLWINVLKKLHDNLLEEHLATKKTYNTLRHKYF